MTRQPSPTRQPSHPHRLVGILSMAAAGSLALSVPASACPLPAPGPLTAGQPDRTPARPDLKEDRSERAIVDLRPKFKKGETLVYKMSLESKSKTAMPALDDAEQQQSTKQDLGLIFTVKDVTDDASIVELTFNSIKVTQENGTGKDKETLEFDSSRPKAKDQDNPLAPGYRELLGTSYTISIDRDGQVTSVTGKGGSTSPSLPALPTPPAGTGSIGGGLPAIGGATSTTPSLTDAIGSIFSVKKGSLLVKVGEKWSTADEIDSGLLGKFKMVTDSTLKSHSGNQATVKVNGRIEPATHAPGSLSMFQIKDSVYVGSYLWDTKAGSLKSMDMDQNVVIDSGSSGGISMNASSKMRVNRVR